MRLLMPKPKKFWSPALISNLGGPASLAGSLTLTHIASANGSIASNVATWTNMNIGTAGGFTTRRIIVAFGGVSGISGSSLTSVTIGGISATVHITSFSNGWTAIASADVPTGTTATIVATFGSNIFATPVADTYSVDDALLLSTTPSTGSGSAGSSPVTTSSYSQTSGGFVIAAGTIDTAGTGLVVTGFTTDFGGGAARNIAAKLTTGLVTGSTTASMAWTGAASGALVVSAWR